MFGGVIVYLEPLRGDFRELLTCSCSRSEHKMIDGKAVVLVVEDSLIIRMGAVDIVVDAGYEALEAPGADAAVRILGVRGDVDLVFTEVQMPGTRDGLELAHYVRFRWPNIAVIIASGTLVPRENLLPEGVRFFSKP